MKTYLYEILVPTVRQNGKPIRLRFHKVWDKKVYDITHGLTIMPVSIGYWKPHTEADVIRERMIPVRIACTEEQIKQIAKMTKKYYEQDAIFYYRVSDEVIIYTGDE